ncbi:MAG TPA: hypothetical protein VGR57_20525 [Ktedonobacterales bacterium]|nr:hypothetical protein [Ktedonobacterales bacterium]
MSDAPPPQHQPPEGTFPGWPPSAAPPAGYPPYPAPYPYYSPYAPPPKRGSNGWVIAGIIAVVVVVVVGSCVGAAYALGQVMRSTLNGLTNSTTVQATTNQQFSVTGTPSLLIDNVTGSVVIHGGAGTTVAVAATVSASGGSTADAERNLKAANVAATQSGDAISIQTTDAGSGSPFFPTTIDLVLTVPSASNISVNLGSGNLEISDVAGKIVATVDAGNFNAQNLTLQDGSRIDVTFGSVLLDGAPAAGANAAVTVQRGEATLSLPASVATHLTATADTGGVSITGWNIPVQQQGSGATATGDLGSGGTGVLNVHVGSGSVVISAR